MRTFLLFVFLGPLLACTSVSGGRVYSPREVNRGLAQLEGRHIAVRGYVLLGTNSRVLYQSGAAHARAERRHESNDDDCLTIINNDELLWDSAGVLRNQTVILEGTLVRRNPRTFDLQGCLMANAEPVPSGFLIDQASLRRAIDRQP